MAWHEFDKSSKWMLKQHGWGILYLGGARHVRLCRAMQAEIVQPRKLPDGLLEVFFEKRKKPDHVLVEVATYPEKSVLEQALDDLTLAYQQLRVLPELLTLVLHPKGKLRISGRQNCKAGYNGLSWPAGGRLWSCGHCRQKICWRRAMWG